MYFYNGSTLLTTVSVNDGGDAVYSGSTPTKAQDAQYTYSFAGWSKTNDNTVDSDALTAVVADRNVYACYNNTLRKYTITWKNSNDTTLETDNNVPYGTTPTYNGSTPVDPSGNSSPFVTWTPTVASVTGNITYTATYKPVYTVTFKSQDGATTLQTKSVVQGNTATYTGTTPTNADQTAFLGWSNSMNSSNADATLTNIQSNKTVYAAFEAVVEVAEITDSWDTIILSIDNETYKTKYKIGNYKPLDLGSTYGTVNMQIVAMDADELADGSGTAQITFVAKELLLQILPMNRSSSNSGGWEATPVMRPTLNDTIYELIPANVKNRISAVSKTYYDSTSQSTKTCSDKIWIPSHREVFAVNYPETTGLMYNKIFKDNTSRVKTKNGVSYGWYLRSAVPSSNSSFYGVKTTGASDTCTANYQNGLGNGVCIGFCLGLEQETISDSWETILANPNYATDYSIGDTKYLDLGTEGKQLMEIVAFDTDDRADGNGKAGITWISKTVLNTKHRMNLDYVANTEGTGTLGGWDKCEMRNYLRGTIKNLIPAEVRDSIVEVTKTTKAYTTSESRTQQITVDDIWIPSFREVYNSDTQDDSGPKYSTIYFDNNSRIKRINGVATVWALRTADSKKYFIRILADGGSNSSATVAE